MKFGELDDTAQKAALEKYRDWNTTDDWWDFVYEDAITCFKQLGIEIGTNERRTMNDKTVQYPDISFSGFWSQGDGCCFGGTLIVADMEKAVEKITAHVGSGGSNDELIALAKRAEELYGEIVAVQMMNRLAHPDENIDYPGCESTMRPTIISKSHHGFSTEIDDNEMPPDIAIRIDDWLEDAARWIYDRLEEEHEHLSSDDSLKESFAANDVQFDEEGTMT